MKVACLLLFTTSLFLYGVKSHLSCRFSGDEEDDVVIRGDFPRTLVSPPGKQGPRGYPGDVTQCDCSQLTEMQEKIKALENVVASLQGMIIIFTVFYGYKFV